MYQIGIIDDVAGQRADIQVAVLDNITEGTPVAFKEYELNSRSKEDLFKEIQEDGFAGMCCHGRENPVEYEEIRIQESESGGGTDGKPYAVGAEWIGYGRNGKGHGD